MKRIFLFTLSLAATVGLLSGSSLCAYAGTEEESEESFQSYGRPISNDQFFGGGHVNSNVLLFQAEQACAHGRYEYAEQLCRRSLDMEDDDIDAHRFLATALEGEFRHQTEKDQDKFKECIKEWLLVMRQERGPEKGLGWHGINPSGKFWEDEEGSILAKNHLIRLTGYAPKPKETDEKYLRRVLHPIDQEVTGTLLNQKGKKNGGANGTTIMVRQNSAKRNKSVSPQPAQSTANHTVEDIDAR